MIKIKNRFTEGIIAKGENLKKCVIDNKADLWEADLRGADLRGADLWEANLREANLRGADLWRADLWRANLRGAKGYSESHEFFQEIVRKQKVSLFLKFEWTMIGQVVIHKICWNTIKKRYGKRFLTVLKKLKDEGWGEYHDRYKEVLKS